MAPAARDVSARLIVKIVLVAAATLGALYVLYLIRSVIGLVLVAIFLALAIAPAVGWIHRPRVPRPAAILLVYVAMAGAIFGIGLLLVPPIVNGVNDLSDDLPGYVEDLRNNETFRRYDDKYDITAKLTEQSEQLPARLGDAAGTLRDVTVNVFTSLVELFSILVITFFLLMEGNRILAFFYRQLSEQREQRVRTIADDVSKAISGYVLGAFLISLLAGVVTYLTLTILDVPFAVPLAIMMAFFDLIPLIGATIAGVIIGIVVAFVDFPTALIVWAIVAIVYQQVENNLIYPVIYGKAVRVHPLIVIIAILIGATLLGILGVLIAVPAAAGAQSLARDLYRYSQLGQEQARAREERERGSPGAPPAPQGEPA